MASKSECEKNNRKFCEMDSEEINGYDIKPTTKQQRINNKKETNYTPPFDDGDCWAYVTKVI